MSPTCRIAADSGVDKLKTTLGVKDEPAEPVELADDGTPIPEGAGANVG